MVEQEIRVPELGGAEEVEVVGVLVKAGDQVNAEDPLLELESDKATVELPAPTSGTIQRMDAQIGDKLKEGDVVGAMTSEEAASSEAEPEPEPESESQTEPEAKPEPAESKPQPEPSSPTSGEARESAAAQPALESASSGEGVLVHAGPAVRKLAREFGADLAQVQGSGPRGRILKEDLQGWVRSQLASGSGQGAGGAGIPGIELPDFSKFGEIERHPMNKIQKLTASGMQRSWLNVPHVTQFDEADITDLEAFRKSHKAEGEARGVKVTLLPFLMKACAYVLEAYPQFKASLDMEAQAFIHKHYCHIGMAVDTPNGLVVPVIRDVERKSIWELAEEAQVLSGKARDKKLTNDDMSGACFTITSLGGIGGTAFTPIVNTPEVAILGVSRAATQPVWDGAAFQPRLMLPLSLSYDHRAINGADAARFTTMMAKVLGDLRELVM